MLGHFIKIFNKSSKKSATYAGLLTLAFALFGMLWSCRTTQSPESTVGSSASAAPTSPEACKTLGGKADANGTCRCEDGIHVVFLATGQNCEQHKAAQTADCTAKKGSILWDTQCRCAPDYNVLAGNACDVNAANPKPTDTTGACVVVRKSSHEVQPMCFDYKDESGCNMAVWTFFSRFSADYESKLVTGKQCDAARESVREEFVASGLAQRGPCVESNEDTVDSKGKSWRLCVVREDTPTTRILVNYFQGNCSDAGATNMNGVACATNKRIGDCLMTAAKTAKRCK